MLSNTQSFFLISTIFFTIFIVNYQVIKYFTIKTNNIITVTNDNMEDNMEDNIETDFLNNSMGSILILFGILKLYDLKKFSTIFLKYNLISQKLSIYPYIYPFIELILGVFLVIRYKLRITYILIIILMMISLVSVLISIYQGKKLRCGCLGSLFHLPLSYVTLSENLVMLVMIFYQYILN
jgi:uncharacterized membrane protein YphA (DoxX/SURF4 family)